jgi:hypothetical protein
MARLPGHQRYAGDALLMSVGIVAMQTAKVKLTTELSVGRTEFRTLMSRPRRSFEQWRQPR